ncbi:hypothetical protein [Maridesulfovibrio ferrireducens]|uniref:hypothetical protein n=1 Tax=Maridesulfovibrio ferrireducens TaxID=246191 RepID=UPI001A309EA2|nr:hypothetical protein [Maridesulfovibrio ferrireducens]MBI9110264.1 hypothetical protein [Maridesulfovibrio ferrireducens]
MNQKPESKICEGRDCSNVLYRIHPATGEYRSDERWKALRFCCAGCFNGKARKEQLEAKKKALRF